MGIVWNCVCTRVLESHLQLSIVLFNVLNSRNSENASLFTGVTDTVSSPVVVYAYICFSQGTTSLFHLDIKEKLLVVMSQ